jgi:putative (di)nucleoside polyphosphate hydrolase
MSPLPYHDRPYRPCIGLVLLNRAGLAFVARRLDTPDSWQFPQGGIDEGEAPETTVLREMKEEIGTDSARIIARTAGWVSYDLPVELADRCWHGKYRGQKQIWFCARFTGSDTEIDLATEHPEFDAWRWIPLAEVPDLIVPFKRSLYDQVVAEFLPLAVPV